MYSGHQKLVWPADLKHFEQKYQPERFLIGFLTLLSVRMFVACYKRFESVNNDIKIQEQTFELAKPLYPKQKMPQRAFC